MQNILSKHTCLYKITSTVIRTSDFFFIILYTQQPILKILFALSKGSKIETLFLAHSGEKTYSPTTTKQKTDSQSTTEPR